MDGRIRTEQKDWELSRKEKLKVGGVSSVGAFIQIFFLLTHVVYSTRYDHICIFLGLKGSICNGEESYKPYFCRVFFFFFKWPTSDRPSDLFN